jgi:hypothetical protein
MAPSVRELPWPVVSGNLAAMTSDNDMAPDAS